MRALLLSAALSLVACGSDEAKTPAAATDAGADVVDAPGDTGPVNKCATVKCASPKVCDPVDGVCKPGLFPRLGQSCGAGGAACTGLPGATCFEDFPDGYCSVTPCSVDNPCPVGGICARVGGKQACFLACEIDGECRGGVDYKCQDFSTLVVSGGRRRGCYLPAFPCTKKEDCPTGLLCNDGKSCS